MSSFLSGLLLTVLVKKLVGELSGVMEFIEKGSFSDRSEQSPNLLNQL